MRQCVWFAYLNGFLTKRSYLDAYNLVGRGGGWGGVRIVTRLGTGRPEVQIPTGTRHFAVLQKCRPAVGTTQPPFQWVTGCFPEGKAAGA